MADEDQNKKKDEAPEIADLASETIEKQPNLIVRTQSIAKEHPLWTAGFIVAVIALILTLLGIYVDYLGQTSYPKLVECQKNFEIYSNTTPDAIFTQVIVSITQTAHANPSNIPSISPSITSTPSPTDTPTPTEPHTETPLPPDPTVTQLPPTPTGTPLGENAYSHTGICGDEFKAPCINLQPESWTALGAYLYGEVQNCRWVEIADLNRKTDGSYRIPLQVEAIYVPNVAPHGSFKSMVKNDDGTYTIIRDCTFTNGELTGSKPCVYTVPEGIFGSGLTTKNDAYSQVAARLYGIELYGFGKDIAEANKSSICPNNPFFLQPGVKIVIPR